MRTHFQRLVVAAVAVPLLAVSVAACGGSGGSGGSGKHGGKGAAGGQATTGTHSSGKGTGARALTKAQLKAAFLAKGDVPGYTPQLNAKGSFDANDAVASDSTSCRPVVDLFSAKPKYPRTAFVSGFLIKGDVAKGGALTGGSVIAALLSAEGPGDAAKTVGDLRHAIGRCRQFKGTDSSGHSTSVSVGPATSQVKAGDESVSFTARETKAKAGESVVTVVRTGDNLVTYISTATHGHAVAVPRAVAAKQHEKIEAAARR